MSESGWKLRNALNQLSMLWRLKGNRSQIKANCVHKTVTILKHNRYILRNAMFVSLWISVQRMTKTKLHKIWGYFYNAFFIIHHYIHIIKQWIHCIFKAQLHITNLKLFIAAVTSLPQHYCVLYSGQPLTQPISLCDTIYVEKLFLETDFFWVWIWHGFAKPCFQAAQI